MWDNAPLLQKVADMLYAVCISAVLSGAAYYVIRLPEFFPLKSVRLATPPQQVDVERMSSIVSKEISGNFFTVDIQRVRKSLETLPWVRNVNIHREFPDLLVVELEEQQALAYWNGTSLVNQQGEIFVANSHQELPKFNGIDEVAAEVVQHYKAFEKKLTELNLEVSEIDLSPRYAWQLHLSNGMSLELGRENIQNRLARFVEAYPYGLSALSGTSKYVDLRYRNGFAVGELLKKS